MRFSFEAIGTTWTIDIDDRLDESALQVIESAVRDRIATFDRVYSRFRDDSLVFEMSQKAGEYMLPADAKPMFDLYEKLYTVTDGAFTPLIGDMLIQAGYDAEYSLIPKKVEPPLRWENTLSYSFPKLTIHTPTMLDLGGIGKGYLVDIVATIIAQNGAKIFTVDAGGDMYVHGRHEIVGLEHPLDHAKVIGKITIDSGSLCGSSGSRRAWANYHHIIDARNQQSPRDVIATWVLADTTLIADAMATCLFLCDAKKLRESFQFEYLILYSDLRIEKSDQFKAELF